MAQKYTADSITVRDTMDGIRSHPGMYLGNIDAKGTFHAFLEIVQNSTDELSACKIKKLTIKIERDSIIVADSGRGIPIGIHKKTNLSALETVLTKLHAGAKSGKKTAYGHTIGVHGVGASVTNALSTKLQVWTTQEPGKWHTMTFAKGRTIQKLEKGKPPLSVHKTGTVIRFSIDTTLLPEPLDINSVKSWCRLASYFHGIEITLDIRGKVIVYPARTPEQLLARKLKQTDLESIIPTFSINEGGVRCIITWVADSSSQLESFVVGAPTLGGTHVKGFEKTLENAFKAVFKSKAKDSYDWAIGLIGFLDISIDQPSFEGQNKSRLATRGASKLVEEVLTQPLIKFLKKYKEQAAIVFEHVSSVSAAMDKARDTIKMASTVKTGTRNKSNLPTSLVGVNPKISPHERELVIVEGESAMGTARKAKLLFQEVLPIQGKIPNVIADGRKAYTNAEVLDIVTSCGYNPKEPTKMGRVSKLIVLADADVDGAHIACLILAMIYKVMPEYFDLKRIYIVEAPLFVGIHKTKSVYGDRLSDLPKGTTLIQRLKGWGSCSAELLRTLAFDPKTRNVINIKAILGKDRLKFEALMGKDATQRKILMGFKVGAE